jgi:hypothetical protein
MPNPFARLVTLNVVYVRQSHAPENASHHLRELVRKILA